MNLEDFNTITVDLLGFPKMLNRVLFNKIDIEKTGKISKAQYLKYYSIKEDFISLILTAKMIQGSFLIL